MIRRVEKDEEIYLKEIGLYIHIPFCRSKCRYCDFNSFPGNETLIPSYIDTLKKELDSYSALLGSHIIKTVFIGGGTPSLLDHHYIKEVMGRLRTICDLYPQAEITIEANPGTLDLQKLIAYRDTGINRISVGLQAWQDKLLKDLGRIHTKDQFLENLANIKKAGFENINIDLIFSLPGQTFDDWKETLDNVIKLKPQHLSCYSLKIEEDTVFGELLEKGELSEPDEELDRLMYRYACDRLTDSGYNHYEISNFSKPGFRCRHNLIYWKADEYIGLGAGAHSYFNGVRYNNKYGIAEYIKSGDSEGFSKENRQEISFAESMSEFMILGLRLLEGVSYNDFEARYGERMTDVFGKPINILESRKLIDVDQHGVKLTSLGLDLANQVFMEFI